MFYYISCKFYYHNFFNFSQAFISLAEASEGYLANRSSKMNIRDFESGCKKCDIGIPHHDIKLVFTYLDANKDGKIDYDDWCKMVPDLS